MSAVAPMPVQTADAVSVRVSRAGRTEFRQEVQSAQIVLLGRITPEWSVIQQLVVTIEQGEDGAILVSDEVFFMYGEGGNPGEALVAYLTALTEYYRLLESHDDEPTVGLFRFLQTYLQPVTR
jgi:hypothetical protein